MAKNYTKEELQHKVEYHSKKLLYFIEKLEEFKNINNSIGFKYNNKK